MSNNLSPWPRVRFTDANGNPLSGGKLYTYRTGTSSPKASYSDSAGTPNTNPVILDSEGYADVWLADDEPYRFRLENSAGVLQWQRDDIAANGDKQVRYVDTIADLRLIEGSTNKLTMAVNGYYSAGDTGVRFYRWNSGSTATDDGGAIIKPTASTTGRWVLEHEKGIVWVEWFGARGDQPSVSQTSYMNAAITYLYNNGGGVVRVGSGSFLCSITMKNYIYLQGVGSSQYTFSTSLTGPTVLKRDEAAGRAISIADTTFTGISDMDIDGNYGGTSATTKHGIVGDRSNYCLIQRVKMINADYGFSGGASDPAGSISFFQCWMRGCQNGIRNVRDSVINECTFSGNKVHALYLNTGQTRIENCFFEFSMTDDVAGVRNAANAIFLDRNVDECIITGNHFDRNAGNSIKIASSGSDVPNKIIITSNEFKGCAWGDDLTTGQRYSILVTGDCTNLTIGHNTFQRRDNIGSTIKGIYSPIGAINYGNATQIVEGPNNYGDLGPLSLVTSDFAWVLSSHGTNEYYLTDTNNTELRPWLIEPTFLRNDTGVLVAGTAGSLSAGEWDFADNDGLGFNTVYVRLSSGAQPSTTTANTVYAIYDYAIVDADDVYDYQALRHRDRKVVAVAAGATETFTLKTREWVQPGATRSGITMSIVGDETTTGADSYFLFPFLLNRASGGSAATTVKNGNIQTYETGFTGGWTAAGTTLEVTVTAYPMGEAVSVALKNTGANRLDLTTELEW